MIKNHYIYYLSLVPDLGRRLLSDSYSPCWTWAVYDGAPFGQGLVLCRDELVARVWLPVEKSEFVALRQELNAQFNRLSAQQGGVAVNRAGLLEESFRSGADLSGLEVYFSPELAPFTRRALRACRQISRGSTCSYGALARQAGSPRGARPLGNVMASNVVPLVIPCHRVVTASGGLGNYGGGAEMKRWLLEKEGVTLR